jgi:hypothetical protein
MEAIRSFETSATTHPKPLQKPEPSICSLFENIQGYEQTWANHLEEMGTDLYGRYHSVIDEVDDVNLDDPNHNGKR